MKVELHLHTNRYSICAANKPVDLMKRLIATGYDAVYITEHDAFWTPGELDELRSEFPRIAIFSGLEKTLDNQHLLILGAGDEGGDSDKKYLAMDNVADVLAKARDDGHAAILAHPFRWRGGADMLHEGLLPDAIEGRTSNHDARCGDLSLITAASLSLPIVNTGDVHALSFINRFYIETQAPIEHADDIRTIILDGKYTNHTGR